jgi:putative membrane protein
MHYTAARVIFAVIGLGFAFAAGAQNMASPAGKASSKDRSFIMQATGGGMVEVELSKLALQNGASSDVKAFAQRMVGDHGKAGMELEMISVKLGVTPPKPMVAQHADMKRFGELKGEKFDKAYVERMVRNHKGTVALFEKQAKSGDSGELRQFASNTLPVLKEHLTMVLALAEKKK